MPLAVDTRQILPGRGRIADVEDRIEFAGPRTGGGEIRHRHGEHNRPAIHGAIAVSLRILRDLDFGTDRSSRVRSGSLSNDSGGRGMASNEGRRPARCWMKTGRVGRSQHCFASRAGFSDKAACDRGADRPFVTVVSADLANERAVWRPPRCYSRCCGPRNSEAVRAAANRASFRIVASRRCRERIEDRKSMRFLGLVPVGRCRPDDLRRGCAAPWSPTPPEEPRRARQPSSSNSITAKISPAGTSRTASSAPGRPTASCSAASAREEAGFARQSCTATSCCGWSIAFRKTATAASACVSRRRAIRPTKGWKSKSSTTRPRSIKKCTWFPPSTRAEFTTRPRPNRGSPSRPGEWNRYEITCLGPHVIVELNGQVVNDVMVDQFKKGAGGHKALSERPQVGYVGLQSHESGGKFEPIDFRNIELKDLTTATPLGIALRRPGRGDGGGGAAGSNGEGSLHRDPRRRDEIRQQPRSRRTHDLSADEGHSPVGRQEFRE